MTRLFVACFSIYLTVPATQEIHLPGRIFTRTSETWSGVPQGGPSKPLGTWWDKNQVSQTGFQVSFPPTAPWSTRANQSLRHPSYRANQRQGSSEKRKPQESTGMMLWDPSATATSPGLVHLDQEVAKKIKLGHVPPVMTLEFNFITGMPC